MAAITVKQFGQIFSEVWPHNAVNDEVDAAVDYDEVAGHKICQPLLQRREVEHVVLWAIDDNRDPAFFILNSFQLFLSSKFYVFFSPCHFKHSNEQSRKIANKEDDHDRRAYLYKHDFTMPKKYEYN